MGEGYGQAGVGVGVGIGVRVGLGVGLGLGSRLGLRLGGLPLVMAHRLTPDDGDHPREGGVGAERAGEGRGDVGRALVEGGRVALGLTEGAAQAHLVRVRVRVRGRVRGRVRVRLTLVGPSTCTAVPG